MLLLPQFGGWSIFFRSITEKKNFGKFFLENFFLENFLENNRYNLKIDFMRLFYDR